MAPNLTFSNNISESSGNITHSTEDISLNYNRRVEIIKQICFHCAFLLFIVASLVAFIGTRKLSFESINILGYFTLRTISSYQSNTVGTLLISIEIVANFLSRMAFPSQPIQCNPDHITEFINAAQLTNYFLPTSLTLFHLIDGSQTSCRLELNPFNSSLYNLFYSTKFNETDLAVYKFTQDHNFTIWNPTEPSHFDRFVKDTYFALSNLVSHRIWINVISQFSSQEESQSMTVFTITRDEDNKVININGLCIHFAEILKALQSIHHDPNSYYAILKEGTNQTILTSDLGVMSPIGMNSIMLLPIFPQLNEINSTFWSLIGQSLEGKPYRQSVFIQTNDPQWSEITKSNANLSETRYVAIKSKLDSLSNSNLYLITVLKLDPIIIDTFLLPALVTASMWLLIAFVIFVITLIKKYGMKASITNATPPMTTVNGSSENLIDSNNTISCMNYNTGSLLKTISLIREFQITISDELSINPILDDCVADLTLPEQDLFSVEVKKNCELCSNLVQVFSVDPDLEIFESTQNALMNSIDQPMNRPPQTTTSSSTSIQIKHEKEIFEVKNVYQIFKKLTALQVKNGNILNWKLMDENPIKVSVNQFLYVIHKFDLFVPEIDPDVLTCFLLEFSSHYISFHLNNFAIFSHLISLLNGPFANWLLDKIDIFLVFFIAFTKDFDYEKVEQIIENNTENSDSLLDKKFLVFQDKYSINHRKLEFILNIYHHYLPSSQHFDDNFKDIFIGIQKNNHIQLFSDFQIRIQSPHFNVHENVLDRRLFIKVILVFCSQWPYISEEKLMNRGIQILNEKILVVNEEDNSNYIKEYHLTYAHCFVKPWLDILSQFAPLPHLSENYQNVIEQFNLDL